MWYGLRLQPKPNPRCRIDGLCFIDRGPGRSTYRLSPFYKVCGMYQKPCPFDTWSCKKGTVPKLQNSNLHPGEGGFPCFCNLGTVPKLQIWGQSLVFKGLRPLTRKETAQQIAEPFTRFQVRQRSRHSVDSPFWLEVSVSPSPLLAPVAVLESAPAEEPASSASALAAELLLFAFSLAASRALLVTGRR